MRYEKSNKAFWLVGVLGGLAFCWMLTSIAQAGCPEECVPDGCGGEVCTGADCASGEECVDGECQEKPVINDEEEPPCSSEDGASPDDSDCSDCDPSSSGGPGSPSGLGSPGSFGDLGGLGGLGGDGSPGKGSIERVEITEDGDVIHHSASPDSYLNPSQGAGSGGWPMCEGLPRSTQAAEPVRLQNGEFYQHVVDMRISGRGGLDFVWSRYYRSRFTGSTTALGHGWDYSYNIYLTQSGSDIVVHNGQHRTDTYENNAGTYTTAGFFRELKADGSDHYKLTFPSKAYWRFYDFDYTTTSWQGKLKEIVDRNGNTISFAYNSTSGELETITDTYGREITVTWSGGKIDKITDFAGRVMDYTYYGSSDPDGNDGDLKSVTTPTVTSSFGNTYTSGKTVTYTYDKTSGDKQHNLLTITDPKGYTGVTNVYDSSDRVSYQDWGNGRVNFHYHEYNVSWSSTNSQWEGDGPHKAALVTIVNDRVGNVREVFFDAYRNLVAQRIHKDRAADDDAVTTLSANRPTGSLRSGEPQSGEQYYEETWEYNSDHRVTKHTDDNGNITDTTYDSTGNKREQGNVLKRKITPDVALGGDQTTIEQNYTYSDIGGCACGSNFVDEYTDPEGNKITQTFDSNGNITKRTQPKVTLRSGSFQKDIQTDMSLVTPGEQLIEENWEYNSFGLMKKYTDPEGNVTEYGYYAENDPDGDGADLISGRSTATGADGGGYLHWIKVDTTAGAGRNSGTNPAVVNIQTYFEYDEIGNVTAVYNGRGVRTEYDYNELDQIVEIRRAAPVPVGKTNPITPSPSEPLAFENFEYKERFWYDLNNRVVLRQVQDYGDTTSVDGNLPTVDLTDLKDELGLTSNPDPDPTGGDVWAETLTKHNDLNHPVESISEVEAGTVIRTKYRYNEKEQLVLTVHPEGNADTYSYDTRNLPFQITQGASSEPADLVKLTGDPGTWTFNRLGGSGTTASVTTINYDGNGNLTEIVDAKDNGGTQSTIAGDGDVTKIDYDGYDRRTTVTDPLGNKTHYTYDAEGHVVRIIQEGDPVDDVAGTTGNKTMSVTEYIYDEVDRLVFTHKVLFETPDVTRSSGRTLTLTDSADMDSLATYLSDATSDTAAVPNAVGLTGTYAVKGRVTSMTEYDRNSRVTHVITDDFDVTRYLYDGAGRMIKVTDSALNNGWVSASSAFDNSALDGNETETAYDDNGNAIEILQTDVTEISNVTDETFRTTYFYDDLNRLVRTVDNIGNATYMRYDSMNRLVAQADAAGPTNGTINRRGLGSSASVTINDFGNVTRTFYDGLGRTVESQTLLTASGEGDGSYIGANINGVKIAIPTSPAYVDTNQSGDGIISVYYAYDDNSQLVGLRDDNGNVTAYIYDNQNRQLKERKGLRVTGTSLAVTGGDTVAFNVSLPSGHTVPEDTESSGTDVVLAYDKDSNITSRTDEAGNVFASTYDGLHRRKSTAVTKVSGFVGTTSQTFKYDGLGRKTEAFDNNEATPTTDDVTCTFAYDSLSRLVEETQQIGSGGSVRAVTCNFDAATSGSVARESQCVYPDDRKVDNTYDDLDRLLSRKDNGQSTAIGTYEYVGSGRVAVLTYQNDTRLTHIGQVSSQNADVGFDDMRRIVNHRWESFSGSDTTPGDDTLLVGFEYEDTVGTPRYDRVHNKLIEYKSHDVDKSEFYRYDSAYRLTDPSTTSDDGFRRGIFLNGNRNSMSSEDVKYYEDWQLDGLGNWEKVWKNSSFEEDRIHSDYNEVVHDGAPVAHWKLNETSGTDAADSVGSSDGTLNGFSGTYWVAGKINNGLEFDGTDDYVNFGSDSSIDITGDYSISAWVYPHVVSGGGYFSIMHKGPGVWHKAFFIQGSKLRGYAYYSGTRASSTSTNASMAINQWQFVTLVMENDTIDLYVDGQEVSYSSQVSGTDTQTSEAAYDLIIGGDGTDWPFDGVIDDVRVFDRALSAAEVEALYELGNTHDDEAPLAYDKNGNLTRTREDVRLEYDTFNRLKAVKSATQTLAEYVYDASNRRMEKVVSNGGVPGDSNLNGTTRYYYHGWRVCEERDGSGNIQRQFTYGNYLDEVWTIDDRDGVTVAQLNDTTGAHRHFAHCNTLYHVYALTDETGALVEAYEYNAYGKATVFTGDGADNTWFTDDDDKANWSAKANPYQYTGQRYDSETGWMYYKNRYFDTDLGRFITRDPIGYIDGLSLFEYVKSNPLRGLDESGLGASFYPFLNGPGIEGPSGGSGGCPQDLGYGTAEFFLDCILACKQASTTQTAHCGSCCATGAKMIEQDAEKELNEENAESVGKLCGAIGKPLRPKPRPTGVYHLPGVLIVLCVLVLACPIIRKKTVALRSNPGIR